MGDFTPAEPLPSLTSSKLDVLLLNHRSAPQFPSRQAIDLSQASH